MNNYNLLICCLVVWPELFWWQMQPLRFGFCNLKWTSMSFLSYSSRVLWRIFNLSAWAVAMSAMLRSSSANCPIFSQPGMPLKTRVVLPVVVAPVLMRKEGTYGVSRIQRGYPVHHHRAHYQGWNGATSAVMCQGQDLIGILSSAPDQVSLILYYSSTKY